MSRILKQFCRLFRTSRYSAHRQESFRPELELLEERQLLSISGRPAVASYDNGAGHVWKSVFFTGYNGHLEERFYDSAVGWQWVDHGRPPDTYVDSDPAVASHDDGAGHVWKSVFLAGWNGHLEERFYSSDLGGWQWVDHGTPPDTLGNGPPAVASYDNGAGHVWKSVFFTGYNGHLEERFYDSAVGWQWVDHGTPPGLSWAGDPAVASYDDGAGHVWKSVFFTAYNGHLEERFYSSDLGGWQWVDHGTTPNGAAASWTPGVASYDDGAGHMWKSVFLISGNHLEERWYASGGSWQWYDHGTVPGESQRDPAVASHDDGAGHVWKSVFLAGWNGHLEERFYSSDLGGWQWVDHGTVPGTLVYSVSRAAVTSYDDGAGYVWKSVFLIGYTGNLVERWYSSGVGSWQWYDHGMPPPSGGAAGPQVGNPKQTRPVQESQAAQPSTMTWDQVCSVPSPISRRRDTKDLFFGTLAGETQVPELLEWLSVSELDLLTENLINTL
jgi:hypothetical protein